MEKLTGEDLRVAVSEEMPFAYEELGESPSLSALLSYMKSHLREANFASNTEELRNILLSYVGGDVNESIYNQMNKIDDNESLNDIKKLKESTSDTTQIQIPRKIKNFVDEMCYDINSSEDYNEDLWDRGTGRDYHLYGKSSSMHADWVMEGVMSEFDDILNTQEKELAVYCYVEFLEEPLWVDDDESLNENYNETFEFMNWIQNYKNGALWDDFTTEFESEEDPDMDEVLSWLENFDEDAYYDYISEQKDDVIEDVKKLSESGTSPNKRKLSKNDIIYRYNFGLPMSEEDILKIGTVEQHKENAERIHAAVLAIKKWDPSISVSRKKDWTSMLLFLRRGAKDELTEEERNELKTVISNVTNFKNIRVYGGDNYLRCNGFVDISPEVTEFINH